MSANPIYHLKDCYFFEVPKALWRQGYQTLDDVPGFLRQAHPDIGDVQTFKEALDGKILIPQPFAKLDSLYSVQSGFGISKYMILQLLVAVVMLVLFTWLAAKIRAAEATKGKLANLLESLSATRLLDQRSTIPTAMPTITAMSIMRVIPLCRSCGRSFFSSWAAICLAWCRGPVRRRRHFQ